VCVQEYVKKRCLRLQAFIWYKYSLVVNIGQTDSSDSSESLLSASPAFVWVSGTSCFDAGVAAGFLLAPRAFSSPSCSATCESQSRK
jgi:hypothetical protein